MYIKFEDCLRGCRCFDVVVFVRDPHFQETLSAFENSIQWAAEGKFTDQDIEEAKITCLAQVSA